MIPKNINSAGVITFKKDDDKLVVLLLDYGKFFSHSKGRVEEGEDPKKTAMRELFEETGLILQFISNRPISTIKYSYFAFKYRVNKQVTFFTGLAKPNQQVRLSFEHQGYVWKSIDSGIILLKCDSDRKALVDSHNWLELQSTDV